MFAPEEYLDLKQTEHAGLFGGVPNVWSVLAHLKGYLEAQLVPSFEGILVGQPFIGERVRIGKGTVVEPGAVIKGPAWIGENCEIRSGCYIRENVIVGNGAVLGNSCEFKNSLLFDGVQVPHFNYVGDSILGFKAHLGAGVILSNVRLDHKEVVVTTPDGMISSGLRKFGAIIGDRSEIGCNAVLSPGSIIGRDSIVYPGSHWRGVLPPDSIAKYAQEFRVLEKRRV